MTDQADALAGKLRDGYETCWKKWACVDIPTQLFAEFSAMATAHFAEEIARAREESAVWESTANSYSDTLDALTAENERLKETLADWVTTYERWTVKNAANAFHPELRPHLEQLEMENERLKGERDVEWRKFLALSRDEQIAALNASAEQAETALARVRAGLTRAKASATENERFGWAFLPLIDELLTLARLAPEGE